jgi:predicted  nucleic acid-binding Zn-ribbon protein
MKTHITLRTILDHIQASKNDLQKQMHALRTDFTSLKTNVTSLRQEMRTGFADVHEELEDAKQHRIALQEDLFETMRVQHTHEKKLARLSRA